jgi:TPR repeat protein
MRALLFIILTLALAPGAAAFAKAPDSNLYSSRITPETAKALRYYETGTKENVELARKMFRLQAQLGDPVAEVNLGFIYCRRQSDDENCEEAMNLYQQAAAKGEAAAYNAIGMQYLWGSGVQKDYATALEWFEKGIAKGNVQAMNNLAGMYAEGQGVERDFAKAEALLLKSAKLGHGNSMFRLGLFYAHCPEEKLRDMPKAIQWWRKAAALTAHYDRDAVKLSKQQLAIAEENGTLQ